jgi:Tfp pilus assembly protein PilO
LKRKVSVVIMVLCVCMVYLFSAYVVTPASENDRESLDAKYKTLQQYEMAVRGAANTEEKIRTLSADMKNFEDRLISEKSNFLAAAKIQGEITELTEKTNLNVATIRPLAAVKLNDYTVVPVYFEGNGNIKQLSNFLKLVESDKLLLKIEKLSINMTNMQKTEDLKFKIQIAGLNRI